MLGGLLSRSLYQLSRDCKSMAHAKQILAQIFQNNIYNGPSSVSAIIAFSATSSQPDLCFASLLFAYIEKPSAFNYNSMIRGLVNANRPARALLVYIEMNRDRPMSDNFTFPFVLKACSLLVAVETGKAVHGQILQVGFSSDPFVLSSLVRMYAEVDEINIARQLFDGAVYRDSVLWNSMIGGYLKGGLLKLACKLFENMPSKNVGTYNAMMGGYVNMGCLKDAQKIFEEMPQRDIVSWNTMIGAHARFGSVDTARKLFRDAPERNVTTWSTIISGFVQSSHFQDSLDLFKEMLVEGVIPNQAILVSIISSCAYLGSLDQGMWLHGYIENFGVELDDILGASLIDMYSKCGMLQGSALVFDKIVNKGVCSWTTMIYGLAIHGHSVRALDMFDEMEKLGIRPNEITFTAVLCACSHAGVVNKGRHLFHVMEEVYNIQPGIEHYTCIIDLLSRTGLLDEAEKLIKAMPIEPDVFVWAALLNGYVMHGRSLLASEYVVKQLEKFGPVDSGPFILMSNIYASTCQWDDVSKMRKMMVEMGVKKIPGCSSLEVDQVVHEFLSGGRSHPESVQVYEMLHQIYNEILMEGSSI